MALTASVAVGAAVPSEAPGAYVALGTLLFLWCVLSRPAAAAPLAVLWFLLSTGFVTNRLGVLGWRGAADVALLGAYLLVAACAVAWVLLAGGGDDAGDGDDVDERAQLPGSSRT